MHAYLLHTAQPGAGGWAAPGKGRWEDVPICADPRVTARAWIHEWGLHSRTQPFPPFDQAWCGCRNTKPTFRLNSFSFYVASCSSLYCNVVSSSRQGPWLYIPLLNANTLITLLPSEQDCHSVSWLQNSALSSVSLSQRLRRCWGCNLGACTGELERIVLIWSVLK